MFIKEELMVLENYLLLLVFFKESMEQQVIFPWNYYVNYSMESDYVKFT